MKKNGFTLVELLATVVILGILVLIAIPAYNVISNNVKQKQNENKISYIETQAAKYVAESGLYSDIDETSITVQTLLQNGYLDGDNKIGDKVEDVYGKDITCYQIKIDFEKGKPVPKFIDENVLNQDGVCIINDLLSKKVLELDAYKIGQLNENKKIEINNHRTAWVNDDVVLKLKINDEELNAKRDQAIINIDWNAVNNNKSYSQSNDNWYTTGWLDNITNYNGNTEYKNIYTVSTSKIMADTKFKISLVVNYLDNNGKKINETLTSYLIVRIDKENPTVTATADTNWTKGNKKIFITGNDKQGSGINHFCIFNSEVANHTCNQGDAAYVPVISENSNKGETTKAKGTYYIWAVDNVGNYSEASARVVVDNIDTTKPTCVYENQNTSWKKGSHTITVKCSDDANGSGCITKPYSVTFANDKTFSNTNLPSAYIITDYAGNKTTCTGPVNVYIDNNAPTINTLSHSKGITTIKVSDTGELSKYEILNSSGTVLKTVTLSGTTSTTTYENATAGTYTLKVYDKAGNTATKDFTIKSYKVTCEDYFVDASNNRKVKLNSSAQTKQYNYGATVSGTAWGTDGARSAYYANYVYKSATSGTVPDNDNLIVYRYFYGWTDLNIYYAGSSTQGGATVAFKVGNGSWTDVTNESNTIQPWGTTYYVKNIRPVHAYEELDKVTNLAWNSANSYYTYTPTAAGTAMNINLKLKQYSIDLNGLLDGTTAGNISGFGTADVYINGALAANDVADYYTSHPYGTTYEIKDIKTSTGRVYNGLASGSAALSGKVGDLGSTLAPGNKGIKLSYSSKYVNVTFTPNGGSGANKTVKFTYGVANQSFPNTGFSRANYTQQKWAESAGGTGVYAINSGVNNDWIIGKYDANSSHAVTLYATWKQNLPATKVVATGAVCYQDWDKTYHCSSAGDDAGYNRINSGCYNNENGAEIGFSFMKDTNYISGSTMNDAGMWYKSGGSVDQTTFTINWNGYKKATVIVGGTYNAPGCDANGSMTFNTTRWENIHSECGCWTENGSRRCSCCGNDATYPKHNQYVFTSNGTGSTSITLKTDASLNDSSSWSNTCIVIEKITLSDPA